MCKLILTRKWRSRYRILFVIIVVLIFASFSMDASFEFLEKSIKTSYLHDLIQNLSQTTVYEQNVLSNINQSKIYFLHIPRTASDSIRTHLIGRTVLLYDRSSYHDGPLENNLVLTKDDIQRFKDYFIIKGFYSYDDLLKHKIIDQQTNRLITIFRHPIERILSLYEFSEHGLLFPSVNRSLSLKEFLLSNDSIIQSLINNSMTWQIGSHLLMNKRQSFLQNHSIFDQAKEHLNRFEFIGFYENLMHDYNELNSRIFSKLNHRSYWLDFLFNLGSWFGFYRMRVLKYSARIKHDESIRTILHRLTFYDMKLYDYAKEHIRHLDFVMFESYFEVLLFIGLRICCILFFIIVFCLGMQMKNKKSVKQF